MLTAPEFRLYPNQDPKEVFFGYSSYNRVVWNKALGLRKTHYKDHKNDKEKEGLNQMPPDKREYKPVENPLAVELAKTKIKARYTSHNPETQEPFRQRIPVEDDIVYGGRRNEN